MTCTCVVLLLIIAIMGFWALFNLELAALKLTYETAMTKEVSAMIMKECPKISYNTQWKGASNYVGRQWQPQLACGADGTLDTRHMKYNCVLLNKNNTQVADSRAGDSCQGCIKKEYWDLWSKKIIAPQILDQSEGDKVCGLDRPEWPIEYE